MHYLVAGGAFIQLYGFQLTPRVVGFQVYASPAVSLWENPLFISQNTFWKTFLINLYEHTL